MSFIETLRKARTSRVAVLHEFWTQYDPQQGRIHAFFEGQDDIAFFSPFIGRFLDRASRLRVYRCDGKARVFEAFNEITRRVPDIRSALFFVDKDLDDVLGVPWPTDPRIFVTDVYSIENYVATSEVLRRLYRDGIRLTNVSFDDTAIVRQFENEHGRFRRMLLGLMAWILLARRADARPNLSNIDLRDLCRVDADCRLKSQCGGRLNRLRSVTGVGPFDESFRRLMRAATELGRIPADRVMRGKFEAWFFVEFWKSVVLQLRRAAAEAGGKVQEKVALEHNTFVTSLVSFVDIPNSLDLFLSAHLTQPGKAISDVRGVEGPIRTWWRRLRNLLPGG